MNTGEIDRIADAINRLRPDWSVKQLRTLLSDQRMTNRPRRDVAVAMTYIACDSATLNPYRVLEAGPWWKAVVVEDTTAGRNYPPRRDEICPKHPAYRATNCGGCRVDQLAGDTTDRPRAAAPPEHRDQALAQIRAALATTHHTQDCAESAEEEK